MKYLFRISEMYQIKVHDVLGGNDVVLELT